MISSARLNQSLRSRIVLLAVLLAALSALGVLAVRAFDGDGSSTLTPVSGAQLGGSGGGLPPASLRAAADALPRYSGAVTDQAPVSTGGDLFTTQFAPDAPAQVIAFYVAELPKQGWQIAGGVTSAVSDKKDDGTQGSMLVANFQMDGQQLTVSAKPNTKIPERGAAYVIIEMKGK